MHFHNNPRKVAIHSETFLLSFGLWFLNFSSWRKDIVSHTQRECFGGEGDFQFVRISQRANSVENAIN